MPLLCPQKADLIADFGRFIMKNISGRVGGEEGERWGIGSELGR